MCAPCSSHAPQGQPLAGPARVGGAGPQVLFPFWGHLISTDRLLLPAELPGSPRTQPEIWTSGSTHPRSSHFVCLRSQGLCTSCTLLKVPVYGQGLQGHLITAPWASGGVWGGEHENHPRGLLGRAQDGTHESPQHLSCHRDTGPATAHTCDKSTGPYNPKKNKPWPARGQDTAHKQLTIHHRKSTPSQPQLPQPQPEAGPQWTRSGNSHVPTPQAWFLRAGWSGNIHGAVETGR